MSNSSLVITISREYGSGGTEVGERIAEALGVPFYDKKLIERAAAQSGIAQEFLEKEGETVSNPLAYLLSFGTGPTGESDNLPATDRVFLIESKVIREVADEGGCVIVGRCADYVLEGRDNVVHIFIHAPLKNRIERIAKMNGSSPEEAAAEIRKIDKGRMNHYQHYTDRKWGRAQNYDITLSTDIIGPEGAAKLIMEYLRTAGDI